MKNSLIIIEDDESTVFAYERYLSKHDFIIKSADSIEKAKKLLAAEHFDAMLLDLRLPEGSSLKWIPEIVKAHPRMPIIVITGLSDIPTAVKAMQFGAANFLTKPIEMENLLLCLQRVIEIERLYKINRANQRLRSPKNLYFGNSAAMQEVLKLAQLVAESDSVILMEGETGSGKGMLARWIHEHCARNDRVLVELNCSGLRGELLQSELFGHAKGAFTTAVKDREGLVELAHGGTLFLDEIGDMDLEVQAQLLKIIEEKTFRRLGENRVRTSDFRLLCASNRDLSKAITTGGFRKDLYYRISVFPLHIPPLRERVDDIEGLALTFLEEFHYPYLNITPEVMRLLKTYSWPGNVRELKNMMERACILARGNVISAEHLLGLQAPKPANREGSSTYHLKEVEISHIEKTLKEFDGDKIMASKALGISLSSIYRRLGKKIPKDI